jgi:two-component system, cell cycle response regulator
MERGTILIIDDNEQIVSLLNDLLHPQGYRLLAATSGIAGLAIAVEQLPDLVLLDVMMPDLNGFTVCQQLRTHPDLAQVPIMMITALDDHESRIRGFEAGADDFITKPFDYAELRARVTTVIRLNRYRRLLAEQARVAAERARFQWVVEESDDGFLVIGPDDQVHYANPRARHYLNLQSALGTAPFHTLAKRHYQCVPAEAWAAWPEETAECGERFLVQTAAHGSAEFWLRVDLLRSHLGDVERVVRLRDVTDQITSQRDMWTFHAVLTHKLRTPLVSILGGLNLITDTNTNHDPAAVRRIAKIALHGARRLQHEIEDILNYLRGPADPYGTDPWTIGDLQQIASDLANEVGIRLMPLAVDPALKAIQPYLTRRSARVVLRELFANARKFHPTHTPRVQLSVAASPPDRIALSVCDNGIHLTPEQLRRVWRPYYQAEKSFTGQLEGMGLGLNLIARIVHAVNGTVTIGNRSDGPGICVTIVLPRAPESRSAS